MSLTGTIQTARSALNAAQIAIQVAGNNMANAATPGYSRQVANLVPIPGPRSDPFHIGRGVGVGSVERKLDEALRARLRSGISDEFGAAKRVALFNQLEGVLNELTDFDLSTQLNEFFNTWSEIASVQDTQSVVIEAGSELANFVRTMRQDLHGLRTQIGAELTNAVVRADELLDDIASINKLIARTEVGPSEANTLRDQRDRLIDELATFMDVTTIEDGQGNLDVLVGSAPVVLAGNSRGLDLIYEEIDGERVPFVVVESDQERLPVTSGTIGGLISARDGTIDVAIADLDQLSAQIIFEVNKLHATGTNAGGFTVSDTDQQIPLPDRSLAYNDPNNQTFSDLPYAAENGGFYVNIANDSTGSTDQVWVDVDLDGLTATGAQGFADDTTPEDIRAAIDAIDGVNADFSPDGRLSVTADPGFAFSFSDDSSGVLGVMGMNAYFVGTDAKTIAVRPDLINDPKALAAGRIVDGQLVENATSIEVAHLQETAFAALGNRTPAQFWIDRVQNVATAASTANSDAEAAQIVRESLEAQNAAVSGVSIDEESINLLTFQRQFQGAAQLITVADEMYQTLLGIL
ncbi:MAG: flagellar hook-associated protein 1 [Phycisphaeraceae bacterium]|nr:MAG: flagellar hook-associated protein 1 [Phycisphaeraceae bacterium]